MKLEELDKEKLEKDIEERVGVKPYKIKVDYDKKYDEYESENWGGFRSYHIYFGEEKEEATALDLFKNSIVILSVFVGYDSEKRIERLSVSDLETFKDEGIKPDYENLLKKIGKMVRKKVLEVL